MDDMLDIPVTYKSNELTFKATYMRYGYTHRFEVDVEGNSIVFEPDEEGNYRAMGHTFESDSHRDVDINLLQEIANTLNFLNR